MIKDILEILQNDAHVTHKQIATMTGLSSAEVSKQVKQAEKDRIILKYKTVINWDRVTDEQVWALIEVKLTPQKDVGFDAVAEDIYRFPQTHSVYLISGTYDLFVLVIAKSNHEVADFVSQKLAHIGGVQGTVTQFVLRKYKEDGEIIEGREDIRRQQVML
jgi:DNA-binding Lrp family transcriptional regulator